MNDLSREQFERAKQAMLEAIEIPASERRALISRLTADDDAVLRHALRWLAAFEADPDASIGTVEIPHEQLAEVLRDRLAAENRPAQSGISTTCPLCGKRGPEGAIFCPDDWEPLVESGSTIAGKTIDGVYKVGKRIGKGGMGSVYEAWHELLQRKMAIKVIAIEYSSHPGLIERFKREGRAVMAIEHPNLVKLHDLRPSAEGILFMALEFVDGETLGAVLRRRRRLPLDEAIELLGQVAEALDAAHRAGVIHRDLKPENIMILERDGRPFVKLMDLGIARLKHTGMTPAATPTQLTNPGVVIGTPGYMSPEQQLSPDSGDLEIDGRADVYSLGVVFHEVLNGCRPFEGRLPDPVEPIPEKVADAIGRALSRDRHERQETAGDLVAEIRRAVYDTAGSSDIDVGETRATKVSPERPAAAGALRAGSRRGLLAVAVVVTIGAVAFVAIGFRDWSLSPLAWEQAPVPVVLQPARAELVSVWLELESKGGEGWVPLVGPLPAGKPFRMCFTSPERAYVYLAAPLGEQGEYSALMTNFDYDRRAANPTVPGQALHNLQVLRLGTKEPQSRFLVVVSPVPPENLPSFGGAPETKLSAAELDTIEALVEEGRKRNVVLEDRTVAGRAMTVVVADAPTAGGPATLAFEIVLTSTGSP